MAIQGPIGIGQPLIACVKPHKEGTSTSFSRMVPTVSRANWSISFLSPTTSQSRESSWNSLTRERRGHAKTGKIHGKSTKRYVIKSYDVTEANSMRYLCTRVY